MRQDARHTRHDAKGFTLIELLIVLIIVGILAGLSVPTYTRTRERSLDREARTALSLIQAGERMFRLREGRFYASSNLDDINADLQLSLTAQSWTYNISATITTFTATATRNGGARVWQIDENDVEASCTIGCL